IRASCPTDILTPNSNAHTTTQPPCTSATNDSPAIFPARSVNRGTGATNSSREKSFSRSSTIEIIPAAVDWNTVAASTPLKASVPASSPVTRPTVVCSTLPSPATSSTGKARFTARRGRSRISLTTSRQAIARPAATASRIPLSAVARRGSGSLRMCVSVEHAKVRILQRRRHDLEPGQLDAESADDALCAQAIKRHTHWSRAVDRHAQPHELTAQRRPIRRVEHQLLLRVPGLEVAGSAAFDDPAAQHDAHVVGRLRFLEVVRGQEHRRTEPVANRVHVRPQPPPAFGIEAGSRL